MRIKKFGLCLMLCLVILSGSFVFTACKKDEGYSLANLYEDYSRIVENHANLSLNEDNEIVFEYSNFTSQNVKYFNSAISNAPYSRLKDFYNPILTYSLNFVSNYIETCANAKLDVDKSTREDLKSALDEFESALNSTYNQTVNVADVLKTGGDIYTNVHMTRLSNLFESYENLYMACFNLGRELSNIYFSYAISNANPNYSLQTLNEFDAYRVTLNLRSRISNQIANLTENYVQQNVRGLKLYQTFTTDESSSYQDILTGYDDFSADVETINIEFSTTLGGYINSSNKKEEFYNSAIELYNIQSNLDNLTDAYALACNEIVYSKIIVDSNATDYQKACAKIIEDYTALINENTTALKNILTILTETNG